MKNLILLIAAAMTLTLFSCGKDDDPQRSSSDLEGEWNITAVDYTGTTTTVTPGFPDIVQDFVGVGRDIEILFTFNDDDSYTSKGSYVVDLTTTFNGVSTTQEVPVLDFLGSGTYEYTDPDLTLTEGDNVSECTVSTLNSSSLVIKATTTVSTTQFGVTNTSVLDYNISFER